MRTINDKAFLDPTSERYSLVVCIRLGENFSVGHLDHALATPFLSKKIAIFAKNEYFQADFSP